MNIDKVKELVQLMVDNDLSSISLRNGGEEITLRRPTENGMARPAVDIPAHVLAMHPGAAFPKVAADPSRNGDDPAAREDEMVKITSPMVGTFYAAPNPEASPFVEVGSKVTSKSVVCIIEAMKVFNEIPAETTGIVEKILVDNQQAVEYGQPLFLIRPE